MIQKRIFTNKKNSYTVIKFKLILVKKFPPLGISILADFRPMGYNLSCCGSICLGKNLLSKSILGRCVSLNLSLSFKSSFLQNHCTII